MTRPKHKTLGAYADIAGVLDSVLREGPLVLDLPTPGRAVNFRQRCYRYRAMLFKKNESDIEKMISRGEVPPGTFPGTPYDAIYIQLDPGGTQLRFNIINREEQLSNLRRPDGTPVVLPGDDSLEADVVELAKRLGFR